MSDREWYPAEWIDETCPTAKPTPDAFIVDCGGAYLLGYALDDGDSDDDERDSLNAPLAAGDIVYFMCCDRLDDVAVTFNKSGNHVVHGTIPAEHHWVRIYGDQDTLQESFDEMVKAIAEGDDFFDLRDMLFPGDVESERVTLQFARWSDRIPHRFIIENGKPKFEQIQPSTANN